MTMIEKVARALAEEHAVYLGEDDPALVKAYGAQNWKLFRRAARAAIEALREPTEGMVTAAIGGYAEHAYYDGVDMEKAMPAALKAAMTAALSEGEG